MMNTTKATLLVNLGSPDSPSVKDVKKYLDEFLMDDNVIDVPYMLRALIVKGFILPFRPKKSAEAYQSIWWKEGSPLIIISKKAHEKVQPKVNHPVALAMRYGNPSIENTLKQLLQQYPEIKEVRLIPLYPHYAMASTKTVIDKVQEVIKQNNWNIQLNILTSFYNEPNYIKALSNSIAPYVQKGFDHFLFSYHGIPERHVKKMDASKTHCLKTENCCNIKSDAHQFCYRHQTFETTKLVVAQLGLKENQYSQSFQSRLGQDAWLLPFTEPELVRLAKSGVKKIAVICPAFVSDCLETLEEIAVRGRELFIESGGEDLQLIPCLNDGDEWATVLAKYAIGNA
jgi:protoporphyrin/coproporphyrin ferrochelatase